MRQIPVPPTNPLYPQQREENLGKTAGFMEYERFNESKRPSTERVADYREGRSAAQVQNLFRFIDWLIDLPIELEEQLTYQIEAFEKEKYMPYITSVERTYLKRGREEGRMEGFKEGFKEGFREGFREGFKEGFKGAIMTLLESRFPGETENIQQKLAPIHSIETLKQILKMSPTVASIEEFIAHIEGIS